MAQRQTAFRETPEFLRGREGEKLVAQRLQQQGWYVIASYDYTGDERDKAPRLHGAAIALVIPDLDVSREGVRQWVEVKTKKAPTYTRMTQQWEHGIPWRHLQHYQEVAAITGCPVHLAVYEEDSGIILIAPLAKLASQVREGNSTVMGHMAFFPRTAFEELADYD